MTTNEYQITQSIEKANDGHFNTPESFKNEFNRLKSSVDLELEPLIRAGQGTYARYLNGILAQFEALAPKVGEPLPKPPLLPVGKNSARNDEDDFSALED